MAKGTTIRMWRRTLVLLVLVAFGFGAVIVNLIRLQIVDGEELKKAAIDQSLRPTTLTAQRGTIYDASGTKILAQSASVWTVALEPAYIKKEDKTVLARGLAEILDMEESEVLELANKNTYFTYLKRKVETDKKDEILAFMEEYHVQPYDEESHAGLVRHVLIRKGFATGELMVCLVINGKKLPAAGELAKRLQTVPGMTSISCSVNREKTNVIMGREIINIWGPGYINDRIGEVKYRISPLSFYQVNPVQTKKLYETALEFAGLKGGETVWDLYCGIGTISLFLAQKAGKVYGVEIVPQAIDDARENARLNHMENVEFFVGKAEEVLPEQYEKNHIRADVIVVDPPRKGCDEKCLETIVKMQPERLVYVSCDSATLARDVKYLREKGYELSRVRGCDMFGQSVHVETAALLIKNK